MLYARISLTFTLNFNTSFEEEVGNSINPMPMSNEKKGETSTPINKVGKIDYVKGVKMLKDATRKKYRVSTNPNAWKKRGCYYIASDTKK